MGAALMVAGTGGFLVGWSAAPIAEVSGANRPIGAGAADPTDNSAHNSPTLVSNPADPANLAVVNRVDLPRFACALHTSSDSGQTWAVRAVPVPPGAEAPPRCSSPDAVFGRDGRLYVSFVLLSGLANTADSAWISRSTDNGRTLLPPVRVAGPLTYQLRLAVDHQRPDRLYLSWLQPSGVTPFGFAAPGGAIVVARSDDGGATWRAPVQISTASRVRALSPSVAVGPQGRLYVLYVDLKEDSLDYEGQHQGRGGEPYPGSWSLVMAHSGDSGTTWREAVVEPRLSPADRILAFFPPSPSLAVDQATGRVYAGFHDRRLGDSDVWVWSSSNGGTRFSPPIRVNDTSRRDATSQYLPQLSVSTDGRLDVLYYDRRADRTDIMNEVSLQSSSDQARNFSPRLRLSDRSFDSRIGFGAERQLPDLGSRLALMSSGNRSTAVWADTRAGTRLSLKQDLASTRVTFSGEPFWSTAMRAMGIALFGVGALLILSGIFRRS